MHIQEPDIQVDRRSKCSVLLRRREGFATLTMTSPILSRRAVLDLTEMIHQCESDDTLSVLVLTGYRYVFCAGADLRAILICTSTADVIDLITPVHKLIRAIMATPLIVIACINGFCLGGGLELALACDLRYCISSFSHNGVKQDAFLGFPEARLGLSTVLGGQSFAAVQAGAGRALQLAAMGVPITAADANTWGLVNYVVEEDSLLWRCESAAEDMTRNSIASLRVVKGVHHSALWIQNLADQQTIDATEFALLATSPDTRLRIQEHLHLQAKKRSDSVQHD